MNNGFLPPLQATRRAVLIGVVAVLFTACAPGPASLDDEVVSRVDALVGRWRAIGSTETRVFLEDGTTSIEGIAADDSSPYRSAAPIASSRQASSRFRWTARPRRRGL